MIRVLTAEEVAIGSEMSAVFCRTYGLHDLADYYASLAEETRSNGIHRAGERPPFPMNQRLLALAYNAWLDEIIWCHEHVSPKRRLILDRT